MVIITRPSNVHQSKEIHKNHGANAEKNIHTHTQVDIAFNSIDFVHL